MNPYEVLNVSPDASPAAIQQAFRKAAKHAHPDCGGDREAFERLHLAYRVLRDPERRARYDATGTVDPDAPDHSQSALMQLLALVLGAVLEHAVQQGVDPTREDLVKHLRDALQSQQKATGERRREVRRARANWQKLAGRFTVTEGPNLLDLLVAGQLARADGVLQQLDAEQKTLEQALTWLQHAAFRAEGRPVVRATAADVLDWLGVSSATSATTW